MMYTLDFVKVFLSQGRPLGHHFIACTEINASRSDPRLREKINLIFFHTSLWCLKRFYEGLKGLRKTFWGTTKKCENKNLS